MEIIYKYPLDYTVLNTITAPIKKVLDIQIHNNKAFLWAIVDTEQVDKNVTILCVGTGTKDLEENQRCNLRYISTTKVDYLVFHWFVSMG